MGRVMPEFGMILNKAERELVLDALRDAFCELDASEDVSQKVCNKVEAAIKIMAQEDKE